MKGLDIAILHKKKKHHEYNIYRFMYYMHIILH